MREEEQLRKINHGNADSFCVSNKLFVCHFGKCLKNYKILKLFWNVFVITVKEREREGERVHEKVRLHFKKFRFSMEHRVPEMCDANERCFYVWMPFCENYVGKICNKLFMFILCWSFDDNFCDNVKFIWRFILFLWSRFQNHEFNLF